MQTSGKEKVVFLDERQGKLRKCFLPILLAGMMEFLLVGKVYSQPASPYEKMLNITWHIGPDMPQSFQDSNGGIIIDDAGRHILISACGFTNSSHFLKKVYALDLENQAAGWFALPDYPTSPRQGLFGDVANNKLYLWGGFNYTSPNNYKDGYRLSKNGGDWSWDTLPDLPWIMCSAAAAVVGSKIYIMGGAHYIKGKGFYTVFEHGGPNPDLGAHLMVIDTDDMASGWQLLSDCPGTPRFVHAMAPINGKLYVIGGAARLLGGPMHTVVDNWKYDPHTDKWTRLADLPVASGNFPDNSLVFNNRYIILTCGYDYKRVFNNRLEVPNYGKPLVSEQVPPLGTGLNADVFVYDVKRNRFGGSDTLPLNNNLPVAAILGNEIFLMGGETGGARLTDYPDGARYDPNGTYYEHRPNLCLIGTIDQSQQCGDFEIP